MLRNIVCVSLLSFFFIARKESLDVSLKGHKGINP